MTTDLQYLQSQINELQNSTAAHKVLVMEALDKALENKAELGAVTARLDGLKDQVSLIQISQVTKQDFEEILETTFNKRLVVGLKRLFIGSIGIAGATLAAWFADHFIWK